MIIVSNTGPLIALAKIERISLLGQVASAAYVPPQVQIELLGKSGPETPALAEALGNSIQIRAVSSLDTATTEILRHLDEGERQAIALAKQYSAETLLLLDDWAGRVAARKLGQPLMGLAGFLLFSKTRGLVSEVIPLLERVRARGYWISDEIISIVKERAGE